MTGNRLDVQALTDFLRQLLVLVDDRDVITGDRQIAADIVANLTRAADNHLHGRGTSRSVVLAVAPVSRVCYGTLTDTPLIRPVVRR